MNALFAWLLALAGLLLALQAITVIVIAARLVKARLWAPLMQPMARAQMPDDFQLVLDVARPRLEDAGFRYTHSCRGRRLIAGSTMPHGYHDVYHDPEQDVYAEVYVADMPTRRWPFRVYLWNAFRDGRVLLTVNGFKHQLIPYPHRVTIADAYALDFAGQFAAHLKAREEIGAQRIDPAESASFSRSLAKDLCAAL